MLSCCCVLSFCLPRRFSGYLLLCLCCRFFTEDATFWSHGLNAVPYSRSPYTEMWGSGLKFHPVSKSWFANRKGAWIFCCCLQSWGSKHDIIICERKCEFFRWYCHAEKCPQREKVSGTSLHLGSCPLLTESLNEAGLFNPELTLSERALVAFWELEVRTARKM